MTPDNYKKECDKILSALEERCKAEGLSVRLHRDIESMFGERIVEYALSNGSLTEVYQVKHNGNTPVWGRVG